MKNFYCCPFYYIYVPTISFPDDKITVTDRNGLQYKFKYYGDPKAHIVSPTSSALFTISMRWNEFSNIITLNITSAKAGTGTISLLDTND